MADAVPEKSVSKVGVIRRSWRWLFCEVDAETDDGERIQQEELRRRKNNELLMRRWDRWHIPARAAYLVAVAFLCQRIHGDFAQLHAAAYWLGFTLLPIVFCPISHLLSEPPGPHERAIQLKERMRSLGTIDDRLSSPLQNAEVRLLLASVDKFVDEAQGVLTSRAGVYFVFGASSFIAAVGTLYIAATFARHSYDDVQVALMLAHAAGTDLTHFIVLRVFAALAVAAAVYAIVKAFISYGGSFFHEGTRMLDRRHALRFGRLYMYMKREQFSFEDLEQAFQWHMESQTVFQSISAAKITDSTLNQLARTVSEAAETVTKVRGAVAPGAKGE